MGRKILTFALVLIILVAMLGAGCSKTDKAMRRGPIHYVALGDSTGVGVGARDGGYVARLFKRLEERRPESKLSNLCVSGATTADLLRDQLARGVALDPDLVTIGIGINDIGHGLTLDQFSKNFEEILSTLKEKTHARIVVSNLPDISTAPQIPSSMRGQYQRQIDDFDKRLEEIASKHDVVVVDVYSITKEELPSHPEYFSADGFHPSDEGYELWASHMWPTLAKAAGVQE